MLRLSPPGHERLLQSPELRAGFGGCEANVAVGLAHLGVRADYVSRLPHNPIGFAACHALQAEGVGTRWILRGGERMGIYFVEPGADIGASRVVYDRARSAFAGFTTSMVDWAQVLEGATWFHGSGITPALGEGPQAVLAAAIAAARGRGGGGLRQSRPELSACPVARPRPPSAHRASGPGHGSTDRQPRGGADNAGHRGRRCLAGTAPRRPVRLSPGGIDTTRGPLGQRTRLERGPVRHLDREHLEQP